MFKYIIVELDNIERGDLPAGLKYRFLSPSGACLFLAFEEVEEADKAGAFATSKGRSYRSYHIQSKNLDPFEIPSERIYLENKK